MSLIAQILERASPERRARRQALIEATSQAFDDCSSLPQFLHATLDGRPGLLNVLSGCFLLQPAPDAQGLSMAWHRCAADDPARLLNIDALPQIGQFVAAMQAQAHQLGAYLPEPQQPAVHS